MPKKNDDSLSAKQESFCREWIVDRHITRAAIAAGYAEKSAHVQGSRLLKNDKIKARINELLQEENREILSRRNRVLRELEYIAFGSITDILRQKDGITEIKNFSEMSTSAKASLASYQENFGEIGLTSKKFKTHDKMKALELLLKYTETLEEENKGSNETEQNEKQEAMKLFANIMKDAYADRTGNKE